MKEKHFIHLFFCVRQNYGFHAFSCFTTLPSVPIPLILMRRTQLTLVMTPSVRIMTRL